MKTLAELEADWHRQEMVRSAAVLVEQSRREAELAEHRDLPLNGERERRIRDAERRLLVASHG